jgi:EmrB/QacA subfamily drug resistance transporter
VTIEQDRGDASTDGPADGGPPTPHVLQALSGLLLGLLVAVMSSTIVITALPRIVADVGGTQASLTWMVTGSLLALSVTTPIWGKAADLVDRKLLVQLALVAWTIGAVGGGLSSSTSQLIFFRCFMGLGAGGLIALVQVILSDLVSARERGRYMGAVGGVMSLATVAGPLMGGVLTDSPLGWRGCFFFGVPFSLAAIVILQRTLHLPRRRRKVKIDYAGALLLAVGISSLLIWVSSAGDSFAWASWQTAAMVGGGAVVLAIAVWVEGRAPEPIISLELFRRRTVVLAVLGGMAIGVVLFSTGIFLTQYMQLARGKSPTQSGLLTIPMVITSLVSSMTIGWVIARTGRYKRYMVVGAALVTVGTGLMATLDETTSLLLLGGYMGITGIGVGLVLQNLILVVLNAVPLRDVGSATSLVAFFQNLGGATGVAALGAVLAAHTRTSIDDGLAAIGSDRTTAGIGDSVPEIASLTRPVLDVVEHAYGLAIGDIYTIAAPFGLIALVAVVLLREVPLGTKSGIEMALEEELETAGSLAGAPPVLTEGGTTLRGGVR